MKRLYSKPLYLYVMPRFIQYYFCIKLPSLYSSMAKTQNIFNRKLVLHIHSLKQINIKQPVFMLNVSCSV